jgi:cytosine permease
MLLAQSKAQVLNNYSASLALTNLLDASLHWRPGRLFSVIAVNVLAIAMLYGRILALINEWITLLGVFTTAFSGVLIADYYIVRRLRPTLRVAAEDCNWAGVVTVLTATALAHFVLARHLPIEFFTSLGSTLLLYPALRLWVFAPR